MATIIDMPTAVERPKPKIEPLDISMRRLLSLGAGEILTAKESVSFPWEYYSPTNAEDLRKMYFNKDEYRAEYGEAEVEKAFQKFFTIYSFNQKRLVTCGQIYLFCKSIQENKIKKFSLTATDKNGVTKIDQKALEIVNLKIGEIYFQATQIKREIDVIIDRIPQSFTIGKILQEIGTISPKILKSNSPAINA